MDELVNRIVRVIRDRLDLTLGDLELSPETCLIGRGLGLDSMAILELVTGLEEELEIEIDESGLSKETLADIGSLARYLRPNLGSG
jgi:acyl carrier protein